MSPRPEVVDHPVLGQSRPNGEWPKRCSLCLREIAEDEVPLMMWAQGGSVMWVYCDADWPKEALAQFGTRDAAMREARLLQDRSERRRPESRGGGLVE